MKKKICYLAIESLDGSLVHSEIILKIRRRPFRTRKKRNVRKVNDELVQTAGNRYGSWLPISSETALKEEMQWFLVIIRWLIYY